MMDQLSSIVLLLSVWSLTIFEKKYFSNILTPFTATAWPFAIISVLVNFICIYLNFPPVTLRVNLFILLNLSILWSVGYVVYKLMYKNKEPTSYIEIFKDFKRYEIFIIIIAWIVILSTFGRLLMIVGERGWWFVGTQEYEDMFIVGLNAHLIQVGKVCFLLLFFILPKSKFKWIIYITLFAMVIAVLAFRVKYHIIWYRGNRATGCKKAIGPNVHP